MISRDLWKKISGVVLPSIDSSSPARQGLQRLLVLRFMVTVMALIACVVFAFMDLLRVPLLLIVLVTLAVAGSLLVGIWRLKHSRIISSRELAAHLAIDVCFLVVVLLFSGGAGNPLISYLLVLLAVAATLLPQTYVTLYAVGAILIYTAFLVVGLQTDEHAHHNSSFQLHLVGMWVTFGVSAILIALFVTRMAATIRSRELTLAQARENEMRNEQLVAIGTLAAGTAHALGTPLSTMSVLLGELDRESENSLKRNTLKDDISTLKQQVNRCKASLDALTSVYNKAGMADDAGITLHQFCEDIRDYIVNVHPGANVDFRVLTDMDEAVISADLTLKHALINIIENAVKAANSKVLVTIDHSADDRLPVSVTVQDDGPGLPQEVMERMGEPFISTRKDSMGIGIFLANAAVQRSGGSIEMFNLKSGGAITVVLLPERQQEGHSR